MLIGDVPLLVGQFMAEAQAAPVLYKSGVICRKSPYKYDIYLIPMSLPVAISTTQCIIFWRVG